MEKYATIHLRETSASKKVKITSDSKPKINAFITKKWQSLIDTLAKVMNVPTGLIMRLNEETIEVFLKSNTHGNPYEQGEKAPLIYGLYCENVIGTQQEMVVPNARKSATWSQNNPDVDLNMISYLGIPINWPDGESFGTVCVLDQKENAYSSDFKNLMQIIREQIESDLEIILKNISLEEKHQELKQLNLVKTKLLSLISHDVRSSIGTVDEFLKLIISDFDKFSKQELLSMIKSISKTAGTSYQTLENLLHWSKHELVNLEPTIVSLNCVQMIDAIVASFQQTLKIKEITVMKDYYAQEAILQADEKMMRVVFQNLLSNAIKYNKNKGHIFIRIRFENHQHIIEIEDTGNGMTPMSVQNLFSYDATHSTQGTAGESSSGIGLILTKEFLDKNNAKISVASTLGEGSTFTITL